VALPCATTAAAHGSLARDRRHGAAARRARGPRRRVRRPHVRARANTLPRRRRPGRRARRPSRARARPSSGTRAISLLGARGAARAVSSNSHLRARFGRPRRPARAYAAGSASGSARARTTAGVARSARARPRARARHGRFARAAARHPRAFSLERRPRHSRRPSSAGASRLGARGLRVVESAPWSCRGGRCWPSARPRERSGARSPGPGTRARR